METLGSAKVKFDWYSLCAAIAMLVIGLVILCWPSESSHVLAIIVASLVVVAGVVRTALYFKQREHASPFSSSGLALGLSLLLIGLLLLINTLTNANNILLTILPMALGCLLVFSGFGSLQTSIELIRLKAKKWFIPLLFALIAIVCGVLAILNPFATASVLMVFLGVALIVEAVLLVISMVMFGKQSRSLL